MSSIHAEPPPPIVTEPTGINYATGSALGKGGFAICHRAERYEGSKPTGHMVALKIVKTKMEPAKLAQKFVSELQIHSKLTHPNIVTFYRAFSFHTSTYVVLELCPNGSLADMLKKRKFLTLPEIRRFVIQICGAVKYLHHRHIVHRDLKTGNLFLDEHMNVKVGDFGLAALLVTEKEMEVKRRTTMCGTPNYLAPEILEKGKGHNEKVDLWSIGVIAYTLAVGKAPFHASSKEEIYKKLKQGDYKWPELSATSNDISSDLRKTVASLLVEEQDRPSPDKIVSQPFFKIAYVPARIPTSAREKAPQWPEVSLPSRTVRLQGWSDSWYALCEESGVGEKNPGDRFPLNGGQRVKSIVHDMEREAQLGTAPVMPIPKETVYKSIVSNWEQTSSPEPEVTEVVQLPSRSLKEISHNEVARSRPAVSARRVERDTELMPPPARPASRVARTATVRKAARTLSEETEKTKASGAVRIASDTENMPAPRAPRSRTTTLTASTTVRDSNVVSSSSQQSASQPSEYPPSKPQRAAPTKRSADASLARRPRATIKKSDRPVSPDPGPLATLEELKQVSPIRRPRRKAPPVDVIEIHADPDSDSQPSKFVSSSSSAPPSYESLALPPPPRMPRALPKPKPTTTNLSTPSNPACHPGTDPSAVLSRLQTLHANLLSALSNTPPPYRSAPVGQTSDALALPFVSKWVDYSVKHGIGYVLASGTIGCVFNATSPKPSTSNPSDPSLTKPGNPVTHVYHPSGRGPLSKLKKDLSNTSHLPLEILEDAGQEGIVKKTYKGLGLVETGPLAAEAARRRALSVLWAKFGRYMCASLDSGDTPQIGSGTGTKRPGSPENFVRFYQRMGGVGFWAFAEGEVQVHFPDHTKFVFSADGMLLNSTLLTPEGAGYLAAESSLLPHHISGREVVAGGLREVLWEGGRVRGRVVRVNEVRSKVEFVARVVGEWVACGGLGRLGRDADVEAEAGSGEELVWEGLSVGSGGSGKKVERVTVGRCGGDGVRERV